MRAETNIDMVRDVTKRLFDVVEITPTAGVEKFWVCSHPFTTSTMSVNPRTGEALDLTQKADFAKYRKMMFETIDKCDLPQVCVLVQTAYKMTWFKYCSPYMGRKDYAEMLKECWVTEENPNQDANVSTTEAVKLFRKASKRHIMDAEEMAYFENLPDVVTVFRGVSPGRERLGLSWTDNREKAEWFKSRFERDGKKGILLTATIAKKDVLAYINARDEREIVADIRKLKEVQEVAK
ncbi:hypothetical protein SELR_17970 [Selenomonas ruminantium subsp. lactilytica TAM6421]|uniref:Uncharacterized protein n=1 Tax=Selenomonas ruminantium subsp. lactilytica (strain NBRC 103574 / TAM6421) TaxID=927704 RepID=I0GRW8_SELRL|nr:hypothetical protein [Selenomonas ruminantium]BAL83505.1 hypothetical protein SELR_17970 [Selenomonas ruminantium subsp. lactilytica TAM6421]